MPEPIASPDYDPQTVAFRPGPQTLPGGDPTALAMALGKILTPMLAPMLASAAGASAQPKRWWQSWTIWMGIAQVLGGAAAAVAGFLQSDTALVSFGIGGIGTGIGTLQGRARPDIRPIGPPAA
jgi:hypothetical protein